MSGQFWSLYTMASVCSFWTLWFCAYLGTRSGGPNKHIAALGAVFLATFWDIARREFDGNSLFSGQQPIEIAKDLAIYGLINTIVFYFAAWSWTWSWAWTLRFQGKK